MATTGKLAYFVSATAGIHRPKLYPIKCLSDPGVQLNLDGKTFLPEHCTVHHQTAEDVYLRSASKYSIGVIGKLAYMYILHVP